MSNVLELTADNFDAEVLQSDMPVLVMFWAKGCRPCLTAAPVIDSLAKQYEGLVKVAKVDADAAPDLVRRYRINQVPTTLFFTGGKLVDANTGLVSKAKLARQLDRVLG